jgi:hypothetical protein
MVWNGIITDQALCIEQVFKPYSRRMQLKNCKMQQFVCIVSLENRVYYKRTGIIWITPESILMENVINQQSD